MQFQMGNKMSRGGTKGNKGGAPTKIQREAKKLAQQYAKEYLEKYLAGVLGKYHELAVKGVRRRKHHPKTGHVYYEVEYSDANQRHWIDKIVPSLNKLEATGKDGRPLVPITVITPNPDEPDPEDQKDGE